MPKIAFCCPDTPWVAADITDCEKCNNRCAPYPWLRSLWAMEFGDMASAHYHQDPKVLSVTELLGCPRRAWYERNIDYTEAPPSMFKRWAGTALHHKIEVHNLTGAAYPHEDGRRCEVKLFMQLDGGYRLAGTVDYIDRDRNIIADHKFTGKRRRTIPDSWASQLSAYKQMGYRPIHTIGDNFNATICNRDTGLEIYQYCWSGKEQIVVEEIVEVDGALDYCIEAAKSIIAALGDGGPEDLEPRGRNIRYWRATLCDYCPSAIRAKCEGLDK